ncbi:hypothetical protein TorRG33x02_349410 [Trema orientale]|uniref:Zinc finger, FYVE/PHD-type n=1 Tax=Trema orientale TaxID=63057 RepID=A0A2P5AIR3_TREOI|nr:hypothetical protein TorRG33x02_349410 [Trema orientale]
MGDKATTITKARIELEEMYSGIPDESVDLTFHDLASLNDQNPNSTENKKPTTNLMEPIPEAKESPLQKIPSLDFSKGLASIDHHHQHLHQYPFHQMNENHVVHPFSTSTTTTTTAHQYHHSHGHVYGHALSPRGHGYGDHHHGHGHTHNQHKMMSPRSLIAESGFRHAVEMSSMAHDDAVSGRSMASVYQDQRGAAGRRRPGIPHSKICAICCNYIYIFRHRCLVCGRVYCRQCVKLGMGEMTEGRKCMQCLGRKFSQRYIQRAGEAGCFCSRYPRVVRQAELKWAEKGPRRNVERGFGRSGMMSSISKSPVTTRSLTGAHANSGPNSFVMTPSYSPYTPTHHHYPF